MSYVLGFVVADGCVGVRRIRKKDGTKQYYFNITSKDKSHLEKIKKAMSTKQGIHSKAGGYTNKKDYYFIQIGHQKICRDLISLGVLPRKTYNLHSIKVPEKYFPDFVQGFFDGDGSVYIYKVNGTHQIKASFVSPTYSFIADFNQRLCRNLNIPLKSIHRDLPDKTKNRKMTRYSICFYVDDCEKLSQFMYKNNSSLYLARKYKIFERWKSIKRRSYLKQNYPSKVGWRLAQQSSV